MSDTLPEKTPAPDGGVRRVRRTQAERSATTRNRVCDATLDALAEVGYERISTTLIAQKANLSRGALTHQFPMRNDLLVAAFQHLVDGWGDSFPFGAQDGDDPIDLCDLIDAIWKGLFSTPRYIAALELMLAARQDNELGLAIRQVMSGWISRRDKRAIFLLRWSPDNEQDALYFQLILSVLRGIAIHQSFDEDEQVATRLIDMWKEIVRQIDRKALTPRQD